MKIKNIGKIKFSKYKGLLSDDDKAKTRKKTVNKILKKSGFKI